MKEQKYDSYMNLFICTQVWLVKKKLKIDLNK